MQASMKLSSWTILRANDKLLTTRYNRRTVRRAREELAARPNFVISVVGRVASSDYNNGCEHRIDDSTSDDTLTWVGGNQSCAGDVVGSVRLTDEEQGCGDGDENDTSGEHCDLSVKCIGKLRCD